MITSPPRLPDDRANLLMQAAWQVHDRETHDVDSLLAVLLPDLSPIARAARFQQITNCLDNASQSETDGHLELAETDQDDAVKLIRDMLDDQTAAARPRPGLAIVR